MSLRPSNHLLGIVLCLMVAALWMMIDSQLRRTHDQIALVKMRRLVQQLRLTDLCLSTEAGYTRHPSQADLYAPFADHPGAFEHFPSGTIIGPPPHLSRIHAPNP